MQYTVKLAAGLAHPYPPRTRNGMEVTFSINVCVTEETGFTSYA